jgi:hypothetical protein
MQSQSTSLNVVIVPPSNISNQAIELSDIVSGWDTYFKLSESGPFPHISLYQAEFPVANIDAIRSKLLAYASAKRSFDISPISEVYKLEDKDFFEVQYLPTDELYELHKDILELLNPLRQGLLRSRDKERFAKLSPDLQKNLEDWGYRLTGSAFRPHLTLARLRDPENVSNASLPKKDFNFQVSQIGLFELGDHGTCVKMIETYKLDG